MKLVQHLLRNSSSVKRPAGGTPAFPHHPEIHPRGVRYSVRNPPPYETHGESVHFKPRSFRKCNNETFFETMCSFYF